MANSFSVKHSPDLIPRRRSLVTPTDVKEARLSLTVSCLIRFQIAWLDESNSVIADGTSAVQELMADGKRFNSVSTLRFTARAEHDGANFTCQAQNSANRQPRSESIG